MAKATKKKRATSTHRKVQSSTVRSRKNIKQTKATKESDSVEVKVVIKSDAKKEPEVVIPEPAEEKAEKILPISRFGLDATPDLLESQIEQIQAAQTEAETLENAEILSEEAPAEAVETPAEEEPVQEDISEEKATEEPAQEETVEASVVEEKIIEKVVVEKPAEEKKIESSYSMHAVAKKQKSRQRVSFGFRRVVLALAFAAAAVFAIVYFVNLNSPDISLRVAAMQSGIDAKYPTYIPRDFNLSDITSENGKIVLNFRNSSTGDAYSITEEQSSWDSTALYENYVRKTYGENYTLIRDQETTHGLALYISGSDACWVNGGVVYKLKTTSGSLTKKQIKAIAVSL